MKICIIKNCTDKHHAIGVCYKHYIIKTKDRRSIYYKKWASNKKEYLAKKQRAYYKTENGKKSVRDAVKKYETNNPERKIAWDKAKKIEKSDCVVCGSSNTHKHHPDVMKPLKVIHLCPLHHKQAHINSEMLQYI